jgi:sporulation protein YlmC with PRC-barrel domain
MLGKWLSAARAAIWIALALEFAALAQAADPPTLPETKTSVEFSDVLTASRLLDLPVLAAPAALGESRVLGRVQDLLIDLRTGYLPFAVIETGDPKLQVLPIACGTLKQSHGKLVWEAPTHELAAAGQTCLEPANLPANEDQAVAWLQACRLAPPWEKGAAAIEFQSLRKLQNLIVQTPSGEQAGVVAEFVLDLKKQRLAYTLLAPATDPQGLRQAPLSAYVRSAQADDAWILELPLPELLQQPPVSPVQLPRTLPRSWIEYVSTRYGRDVEGGLQEKLFTDRQLPAP